MITENVKNLFSFIDFLHSKIEYLLSKQDIVDELFEIKEKRDNLSLSNNYRDKLELRKIQELLNQKWKFVEQEVSKPITDKIDEFDVVTDRNLNYIKAESELVNLQNNFEEEDLEAIFSVKEKYLEFRSKTNFHYFTGAFFIDNLDRTLKEFYEFFKDEDYNEFNKLQTNVVPVESLDEQGLEKAVRKLIGNSNKLHFETFPEFLNYYKTNFKDVEIDERHGEAKRLFEQRKLMLENSTFQSEIDEVKELSENAVKDFKRRLMLSFTNENYKTKYNRGVNPVIAISKLYFEYEKLYNDAVSKNAHLEALPSQLNNVNESRTKNVIFEIIKNIDKQGWQYAFVSEQDYNLFTDLLTNFFEYKPYELPKELIQLKRTCKTKVAKALGEIHKELSNENNLKSDTKYFELIRVLSHFEKEPISDLYKALTR